MFNFASSKNKLETFMRPWTKMSHKIWRLPLNVSVPLKNRLLCVQVQLYKNFNTYCKGILQYVCHVMSLKKRHFQLKGFKNSSKTRSICSFLSFHFYFLVTLTNVMNLIFPFMMRVNMFFLIIMFLLFCFLRNN